MGYEEKSENLITREDEGMLVGTCVNLDLMKLSVIKDNDALTRYTFYAAPSARAFTFFHAVSQKFGAPYYQCNFSYYDDELNPQPIIIIFGNESLSSLGINKENSVISMTISQPTVSNTVSSTNFAQDDELFRLSNSISCHFVSYWYI